MNNQPKPTLIDANEIRSMFRCSRRSIKIWSNAGLITPVDQKGKQKLFDKAAVIRVLTMDNDRYKKMLEYGNRGDYEDSFTTGEAARMLGVSRHTAERWFDDWMAENGKARGVGAWAKLTRTQVRLVAQFHDVPVKWPTDDEILLTVREAADYLGVGRKRMWRMDRDETLIAAVRTPSGMLRWTKSQLCQIAAKYPDEYPFAVKTEVL